MPRFVVLEHTGTATYKPGIHWDLMLEVGQSLRTWELDALPTPGATVLAARLPDHRLDYLQYEGPISGERGSVRRFDCGTYETVRESQLELVVRVEGQKLQGRLRLDRPDSTGRWRIAFERS